MPTSNRRLMLAVPPDIDRVIERMAKLHEKPASTVVIDLLRELAPALEDLCKLQEAVRAGRSAAAKQALRHMMGDVLAEAMTASQPDMFQSKGKRK